MHIKNTASKLIKRLAWIVQGCPKLPPMLEMVWPSFRKVVPKFKVPHDYTLRQFTPLDRRRYEKLLIAAGMDLCSFTYWDKHILADGFFVIENNKDGNLVAACFASHHPTERHARAGNFGWLATDPLHRGKGLGYAVSAAVTSRLIKAGYKNIYLETHDHRLAAIKIYLSMGWIPLLYCNGMYQRWESICKKIGFSFSPNEWRMAVSGLKLSDASVKKQSKSLPLK